MSAVELAFVVIVVSLVVFGARAIGAALGVSAWFPGVALAAVVVLLLRAARRHVRANLYPSCIHGRCGPEDYTCEMSIDGQLRLRCRCQHLYTMRRGRAFLVIDETGAARPFMMRSAFGAWRPDPEARPVPVPAMTGSGKNG